MGRNQNHSFSAHPKGWLTKWATANATANATHVRHIRKDGLLSGAQEPINAIAGNKALFRVQNHDTYYAAI